MNWLDILIIVGLGLLIFLGLIRGLIRAAIAMAGVVGGIILAGIYYAPLSQWLSHYIHQDNAARILSFAFILIAVMVAAFVLGRFLHRLARLVKLGWADRLGGAIIGLVIGALSLGAILAILAKFPFDGVGATIQESAMASVLLKHVPLVLGLLPEEFDSVRSFFQ